MNHIAVRLRDVFFNKRTGRLIYRRKDILKYLFFEKGAIFQVKTNQPDERLGEILYKLERIPKEAHARLDEYIEPNKNLGEVLRTRGVISEDDLAEALSHQIREAVLNVFPFFDAEFDFQPHEGFGAGTVESRVSVPLLIEYGIRRMQPNPLLQAFLARQTPVLGLKTYAYLLTAEERDILDKVNGADPAEVILKTLTMPGEQFWKSLYLFYCLGVVDLPGLGSGAPAADLRERVRPPSAVRPDVPREIAEVLSLRDMLPAMTLYQILDVPKTASEEDIKKAYFALARKFHPDRFDRKAAAEFKGPIDEVFDGINNAYRVLSNKDSRRVYDAKSAPAASQEDVQETYRRADVKFRQGKTLYGQGRYDEAIAYLEEAIRIRRDKGDYFLLLAMCESKIKAFGRKAEQDFLKAIQLEPWNPEGYVGLAMLYKAAGLQTKAVKQLEKALEAEPEHASAREALDELTGGKKRSAKTTLFGIDLFGAKKKRK
ncbi:MAG TPA: DnaJ domain-containing protein [Candidatus Aminicenantes bacterium]|nr:DnaJ domain-containing protein [Candidatus Aminicenantes bacterium]